FSIEDKRLIARTLDEIGIDYIEGGYPGANPTDTEFFGTDPGFAHATFTAFGMTKRAGIRQSIEAVAESGREAMLDCEHFFDGYKANRAYALAAARIAHEAGARWIVLCDTNGGTLPDEIAAIVADVVRHVPGSHLGIHTHNDTENAVANSLAAVRAGARQI